MNYNVGFNIDESGEIFVTLTKIDNGNVILNEKVTDKIAVIIKQTIAGVEDKLSDCESLLYDAQDLLDNVHCYDTEVYRNISRYFNGDEDEEELEDEE